MADEDYNDYDGGDVGYVLGTSRFFLLNLVVRGLSFVLQRLCVDGSSVHRGLVFLLRWRASV